MRLGVKVRAPISAAWLQGNLGPVAEEMQALGNRGCFSLCPALAASGMVLTHTCTSGMIEHQRTRWIARSLATQQSEMTPISPPSRCR
jgi:hypothetical protein